MKKEFTGWEMTFEIHTSGKQVKEIKRTPFIFTIFTKHRKNTTRLEK